MLTQCLVCPKAALTGMQRPKKALQTEPADKSLACLIIVKFQTLHLEAKRDIVRYRDDGDATRLIPLLAAMHGAIINLVILAWG
jgi:hypothetical protein